MKTLLRLISFIVLTYPTATTAQKRSLVDILTKVDQAISKLEQGQYTFRDRVSKRATNEDSTHSEHISLCFFKKNPNDSLIGYQLASFREDGYQQVYDGEQLFTVYEQTLEVVSKQKYPAKIKDQLDNFTGPNYLTATNRLLQYFKQLSTAQPMRLLGLDHVQGEQCYKLAIEDLSNPQRTSRTDYYVSVNSFLPLRTVSTLVSIVGNVLTPFGEPVLTGV